MSGRTVTVENIGSGAKGLGKLLGFFETQFPYVRRVIIPTVVELK